MKCPCLGKVEVRFEQVATQSLGWKLGESCIVYTCCRHSAKRTHSVEGEGWLMAHLHVILPMMTLTSSPSPHEYPPSFV